MIPSLSFFHRDRVVVGNNMTINISDCNQEADMYLFIHDCSDLLTAIFLIDTSLNCPILTPAFSCGVACPRSSPTAGAVSSF